MFADWVRLTHDDPLTVNAVNAANGMWALEVLRAIKGGHMTAWDTPYGVCVLSLEAPEVVVVSFRGKNLGEAAAYLKGLMASSKKFNTLRLHTDSPSVLRLWRKYGIMPEEYIARI